MRLWAAFWRASSLLLVSGSLNFGYPQKRTYVPPPSTHMSCFEYSRLDGQRFGRAYNEEWRSRKPASRTKISGYYPTSYPNHMINANQIMSRRSDKLFPKGGDLVKEHAKLVQDINSLEQIIFVAPLEDTKDVIYDDSIFHEIIETSTTTTARPTTRAVRPTRTGFPVIFIGGESTRHVSRSPSFPYPKSISLIGTTTTPLLKHPYPFVMQGTTEKPLRVCMSTLPPYPVTKRPGLLQRLLNAILPRPR